MRVWVARRRQAGALLLEAVQIGEVAEPYELVVAEVTDQGQRRPTKVARLIPWGTRRAVVELISPKLVWFKELSFVLAGREELVAPSGAKEVAQAWLCRIAPPAGAGGLKARCTHRDGVMLRSRELHDHNATTSGGSLMISGVPDQAVGRYTIRAELLDPLRSSWQRPHLVDCELDWMSEEHFSLSGFEYTSAYADRPSRLLRQGWLCNFDLQPPGERDEFPHRAGRTQR